MCLPVVSVVTSVYNGERYLLPSLESVLGQQGVDLELIVVNDGSTDRTGQVLDDFASRDNRLRVLHQTNRGLTEALARGCSEARGQYIARHDADDLSLPGRLRQQQRLLNDDTGLSMVSCWGLAVGPGDETLFEVRRPSDPERATADLLDQDLGPAGHGSVMFRADEYRAVGGYRPAFRVAQDWDLWLRLVERGRIGFVPETLYAYRVDEYSVSARRRDQQLRLLAVSRKCRAARLRGDPEALLLEEAASISAEPRQGKESPRINNSYFIGKCLLDRRDRRALLYLARSVQKSPWRWRGWAALVLALWRCPRGPTLAGPCHAPARPDDVPAARAEK
jgi:glycosyltransferase involved in cell wall biosynthesis